jgi:hypothetical protein
MDVRSSKGPPRPLPTEDVAVQLRMERGAAWERGNRLARVLAEIEASGGQLAPHPAIVLVCARRGCANALSPTPSGPVRVWLASRNRRRLGQRRGAVDALVSNAPSARLRFIPPAMPDCGNVRSIWVLVDQDRLDGNAAKAAVELDQGCACRRRADAVRALSPVGGVGRIRDNRGRCPAGRRCRCLCRRRRAHCRHRRCPGRSRSRSRRPR